MDKQFSDELERLEETYAISSGFMERAPTSCSWRTANKLCFHHCGGGKPTLRAIKATQMIMATIHA